MRSRTGPPSISYTGMPSARAFTSSMAFSMAAMACWTKPPEAWRRCAYIRVTWASHARGSLPMTDGASRSMTAERPAPPNDSLYSAQPTSPVLVVSLRKSKLRVPASQCSDSSLAIFMGGPSWMSVGAVSAQHAHGRATEEGLHVLQGMAVEHAIGLLGDVAQMRRDHDVGQRAEGMVGREGLGLEHVEPGARDGAVAEGTHQRGLVHDGPPRGVHEIRRPLHEPELARAQEAARALAQDEMNRHDVGSPEQLVLGHERRPHLLRPGRGEVLAPCEHRHLEGAPHPGHA